MGLFSRPKDVVEQPTEATRAPTPKRSAQVQGQMRPLVPDDRKEAKKAARAKMQVEREKARVGFEQGDARYLPARDKGEVRKYVRDFVDARISVATLMIPAMIVVIMLTFWDDSEVRVFANLALWAFIAVAILDCVVLSLTLRRRVAKKFGPEHTKGNGWYASMRAAQLPFMRLPKPQVKLFQFPD